MSESNALLKSIRHSLRTKEETLSVAESCTGGGLSYEITKYPGASFIFLGGVTSYANFAKSHILHIPESLLKEKGAVSEEVAILMAKNCRNLFSSTWALSTTGIAGPKGGSIEKPVGLIFIGIAGPHISFAKRYVFARMDRLSHQKKSIKQALSLLGEVINVSST